MKWICFDEEYLSKPVVDYKLLVFLVLSFQRSNALNKLSVAGLVTFIKKK